MNKIFLVLLFSSMLFASFKVQGFGQDITKDGSITRAKKSAREQAIQSFYTQVKTSFEIERVCKGDVCWVENKYKSEHNSRGSAECLFAKIKTTSESVPNSEAFLFTTRLTGICEVVEKKEQEVGKTVVEKPEPKDKIEKKVVVQKPEPKEQIEKKVVIQKPVKKIPPKPKLTVTVDYNGTKNYNKEIFVIPEKELENIKLKSGQKNYKIQKFLKGEKFSEKLEVGKYLVGVAFTKSKYFTFPFQKIEFIQILKNQKLQFNISDEDLRYWKY
jgi:predicted small secreted protein